MTGRQFKKSHPEFQAGLNGFKRLKPAQAGSAPFTSTPCPFKITNACQTFPGGVRLLSPQEMRRRSELYAHATTQDHQDHSPH
jgi:hypothetical protein